MPTNAPIEELSVKIAADVSSFVQDVEVGIEAVEKLLDNMASEAKKIGVIGLNTEETEIAIRGLAEVLGVDLQAAFDLVSESARRTGTSLGQVAQGIEAIDRTKGGLQDLGKTFEETAEAEKKVVKTRKEHTKATNKTTSALKRLAGRLLVGLGLYNIVSKAWRAFTGLLKDSLQAIRELADETSAYSVEMKRMKQDQEEAKLAIGSLLAPLDILKERLKTTAMQVVFLGVHLIEEIAKKAIPTAIAAIAAFITFFSTSILSAENKVKKFGLNFRLAFTRDPAEIAKLEAELATVEDGITNFNDTLAESKAVFEDVFDEIEGKITAFIDTYKIVPDIVKSVFAKIAKEFDKFTKRSDEALAKIEARLAKRMADIETRWLRRGADAWTKFQRKMADIDREAAKDRIENIQDNQVKEFRIREDFQNRLLDLENNYILNLEDAVRERDARAVLMLQRRFNLEKRELTADKNLRLKRLKEDFQLELIEIERQKQIRKIEARLAYDEELIEIDLHRERQEADADLAYQRSLTDLRNHNIAKLREITNGLLAQYNLNADQMAQLYELGVDYYGPGGYWETLMRNAAAEMAGIDLSPSTPQGSATSPYIQYYNVPERRQRGGSFVATSPQTISVAEGAPEMVNITPLSQATGRPRAGFPGGGTGGGGGSQHTVDINLGENLQAHIVDQAVDAVADVVVKINQGGR